MGRGSSKIGGGPNLGPSKNKRINILSETDVWSYRHNRNNEPFVDAINAGVETIENDFPGMMQDVNYVFASKLGGKSKKGVLGYYSPDEKAVALNDYYVDIDKMNGTYDISTRSGYHPARGIKTGTEAVALHEMGHALTDHVGKKIGLTDLDAAAERIVNNAYAAVRGTGGTKAWAKGISGYATESNAECIAEAVSDWYCNGSRAAAQSKAIMAELRKYT